MTVYRCIRCGITTDTGLCPDFETPDHYPEFGAHEMVEYVEPALTMSLEDVIALANQNDDLWSDD